MPVNSRPHDLREYIRARTSSKCRNRRQSLSVQQSIYGASKPLFIVLSDCMLVALRRPKWSNVAVHVRDRTTRRRTDNRAESHAKYNAGTAAGTSPTHRPSARPPVLPAPAYLGTEHTHVLPLSPVLKLFQDRGDALVPHHLSDQLPQLVAPSHLHLRLAVDARVRQPQLPEAYLHHR